MLCPYCGKDRGERKCCPKCHKIQRTKWRGVLDPGFMQELFSPDNDDVEAADKPSPVIAGAAKADMEDKIEPLGVKLFTRYLRKKRK
jgi:hypothetical protein